jgi:hypothetical protein
MILLLVGFRLYPLRCDYCYISFYNQDDAIGHTAVTVHDKAHMHREAASFVGARSVESN